MTAMADRLLALAEAYPGLHLRELARQLDTSLALVEYHVEALAAEGRLEVRPDGRFRRVYAKGAANVRAADRRALDLLRRRWPLRIVVELLRDGSPLRHAELCARLGLGKGNLSFHLGALEKAGVVRRDAQGLVRLAEPARLRALLERWQPTPDVRSELEEAFDALYGGD